MQALHIAGILRWRPLRSRLESREVQGPTVKTCHRRSNWGLIERPRSWRRNSHQLNIWGGRWDPWSPSRARSWSRCGARHGTRGGQRRGCVRGGRPCWVGIRQWHTRNSQWRHSRSTRSRRYRRCVSLRQRHGFPKSLPWVMLESAFL